MTNTQCPFDMRDVGNAISESLTDQGFPRCKFVVIVLDENNNKSIATNLIEADSVSQLLIEAAMIMKMAADLEEPVGHA
jgi:hypothetical protein